MKKIIIFLILANNIGIALSHNLSADDRKNMTHEHKKILVQNVTANDSLEIWTNLMKNEYNSNISSDYKIEVKNIKGKSSINLTIYKPKSSEPEEAIIDLHGCNGVMGRQTQWARKFISWNYMFVIIDSLRARGVDNVCQDYYRVPTYQRAIDAHTTKRFLQQNYSNIKKDSIVLFGFSHGATAVLDSLYDSMGNNINPFKKAIAFSPWCPGFYTKINTKYTKLMIIAGDRDTWTPSNRCEKMLTTKKENFIIHVLEGAYHSFDGLMDIQSYQGHTIGHSVKATNESIQYVKEFLKIKQKKDNMIKDTDSKYRNLDIPIN